MGWSYSSLKTFDQCPKKYHHIKVIKDVQDKGGSAANYGKALHLAAEEYIRDGKELPQIFKFIQPILDALNAIPGVKHCEIRLGIKEVRGKYVACDFDDPQHWWHGIADLAIIDHGLAWLVDYKSGKSARFADTKQLDLLAAGMFLKFPHLLTIKSALAFVCCKEFVRKEHFTEFRHEYMNAMKPELDRLEAAKKNDVWNPVSGPLCRFCPVSECPHNEE